MKSNFLSFFHQHAYKLLIACFALILISGSIISWYFLYMKKTPEYSLDLIRKSIETHDSKTFQTHVDLKNILAYGYDDLMYVMIDSNQTMRPEAKAMLLSFSQMLKSPVVSSFESGILHYIETGDWKKDADIQQASRYQALPDIQPEKLADKVGFQTITYIGAENISKDNAAASADIRILETETQKEFILNIKMDELEDGSWRITDITNTRDYLVEISQARKEILKEYLINTQPIIVKHQEAIQSLQNQLNILSPLKTQSDAVKEILRNQLLPQWAAYKEELNSVTVPGIAKELSQLRAKVIELRQQYIEKQIEQVDHPSFNLENDMKTLDLQANELNYRIKVLTQQSLTED